MVQLISLTIESLGFRFSDISQQIIGWWHVEALNGILLVLVNLVFSYDNVHQVYDHEKTLNTGHHDIFLLVFGLRSDFI